MKIVENILLAAAAAIHASNEQSLLPYLAAKGEGGEGVHDVPHVELGRVQDAQNAAY